MTTEASLVERIRASGPACKATEVGLLPNDWQLCDIGDLQPFVTSGSRGWARYYSDIGLPFVRITNVSRDCIFLDLADLKFVHLPPGLSESDRTEIKNGDVLISITADIGIVGYIDSRLSKPAYINQHLALVRLDSKQTDSKFVSYFLASEGPQRLFRGLTDQGAKAGMSLLTIRKLKVARPSLQEQRAISAALSDVDELIDTLDRLITKKRAIKLATMQQLISGKRRLGRFQSLAGITHTNAGPVPRDWQLKELGKISSMHGRIGWQGLKQSEFTSNVDDPFLITGMNFKDGDIAWEEVYHVPRKRYELAPEIQLRTGDVLMTKDGTIGKLLYVSKIPSPGFATLNSHLLVFRPIKGSFVPRFLYYQLQSRRFREHIELNKSGSTFFGLSQEATGKFQVVLPSIEEQEAIAKVLCDQDAEISAHELRRSKVHAIKRGMMQALLTGRTRLVTSEARA